MKVIDYLNDCAERNLESLDLFFSTEYPIKPFDELIIDFLDDYSRLILRDNVLNRKPDMVSLGFWLRKSHINQIKIENDSIIQSNKFVLAPRGAALHIVPANVDTMFIYSMSISLLVGNKNLIRLSNRMLSVEVKQLIKILHNLILDPRYNIFRIYIFMIQYGYDEDINNWISSRVNLRIIWGGDSTILTFRKFISGPRTKDIVFADRVSLMFLKSKTILNLGEVETHRFIKNFYNDTYTFNQLGCSSPQTIFFIGNQEEKKSVEQLLIGYISKYVVDFNHDLDFNSIASLKQNKLLDDTIDDKINSYQGNSILMFANLNSFDSAYDFHGCGAGYFYTKHLNELKELQLNSSPKIQTITHFGFQTFELDIFKSLINNVGVDRIVPLGKALNFDYIWDGYNLIEEFSRKVSFET